QVRTGRGVPELPRLEVPGARSPCPPLQLPTEGREPPNRRVRVARFGPLTASHSRRVRLSRLNPFGPCLARFQARGPVCPRAVRSFGRSHQRRLAELRCARRGGGPKRATRARSVAVCQGLSCRCPRTDSRR